MTRKSETRLAGVDDDASPFLIEFFMVQGIDFRCMAYCGHDGRWRSAYYNEELAGSIRIVD